MEPKSVSAFFFGLFAVLLAALFGPFLAGQRIIQLSQGGIAAMSVIGAWSWILYIVLGSAMQSNWLGAAQTILSLIIIVTVSASTNILVGLAVGVVVFGFFSFTGASLRSGEASILGTGFKWIMGTAGGWAVGFVLDKMFR